MTQQGLNNSLRPNLYTLTTSKKAFQRQTKQRKVRDQYLFDLHRGKRKRADEVMLKARVVSPSTHSNTILIFHPSQGLSASENFCRFDAIIVHIYLEEFRKSE